MRTTKHGADIKINSSFVHFVPIYGQEDHSQVRLTVSNVWHDILKESSSPDSFKENYLSVLCASSAAGGEIIKALLGLLSCHPFLRGYLSSYSLTPGNIWIPAFAGIQNDH